jgi:hypothetical protein
MGASKNDCWAYGTFIVNNAPILRQDLHNLQKRTKTRFHLCLVTSEYHRCVQNDYWAYVAQTMHLSCIDTNTVSKWTEKRFHMTYLASRLALTPNGTKWAFTWARNIGVPSGASKTISEPMVRLAQVVHLACSNTNAVSECTKMRFHMSHVT